MAYKAYIYDYGACRDSSPSSTHPSLQGLFCKGAPVALVHTFPGSSPGP